MAHLHATSGATGASGTINISGAGSQLVLAGVGGQNTQGLDGVGAVIVVGRDRGAGTGGGSGTINITAGGALVVSDNGQAASSGVGVDVARGTRQLRNGHGLRRRLFDHRVIDGRRPCDAVCASLATAATAQMTISDGATVSVLGSGQRNFTVNNSATGSGVLTMTNGATIVASRFAVADNGGTGTATIDNSTVNLDGVIFFNGAPIGPRCRRSAAAIGANGLLTMQNGAVININNTIDERQRASWAEPARSRAGPAR